jgi:hypothetical protein
MAGKLDGKRVAIVATDGFEQSELTEPRRALEAAGARTEIVSLRAGKIRGWKSREWGDAFDVDKTVGQANPDDYDALVLPGGVIIPTSFAWIPMPSRSCASSSTTESRSGRSAMGRGRSSTPVS